MKDYKRLTETQNGFVIDNCANCPNINKPQGCTAKKCYEIKKKRLAYLEDKIDSGEIDYVADKDKQIASLTAENDNLTVELEAAQRDVENLTRTLEEANDEIKALEAENAQLKQTLSKMETVEKELRERLDKAVELPMLQVVKEIADLTSWYIKTKMDVL